MARTCHIFLPASRPHKHIRFSHLVASLQDIRHAHHSQLVRQLSSCTEVGRIMVLYILHRKSMFPEFSLSLGPLDQLVHKIHEHNLQPLYIYYIVEHRPILRA